MGLLSCEGEDGTNGLDGKDGINGVDGKDGHDGVNGTDGANGADGTNGEGFDELVKYGNITIMLDGTRPDNIVFKDTTSFRFTSVLDYGERPYNNLFRTENADKTNNYEFGVRRFLTAPDDTYQYSISDIVLNVNRVGEADQSFDFKLSLSYYVVSNDNKYFEINNYFDSEITNLEITNYSFDETTNNLKFSFAFDVAAVDNSTRNDLKVSGVVDVFVLERIDTSVMP
ncbi:collagen-like protein [Aquimarina sp. TRL1]|nr:collagen-like protein [Aquimarina sp. TRL1]